MVVIIILIGCYKSRMCILSNMSLSETDTEKEEGHTNARKLVCWRVSEELLAKYFGKYFGLVYVCVYMLT